MDRDRYLTRYLQRAPLAVALWRTCEADALSAVQLTGPLLDVGCGFGEFGEIFFEGARGPDVGIDINRGDLLRAAKASTYGCVLQADGRRMPFADASFASVISISTLEHILGVEAVMAEIARILRPGGTLAFTVPIDSFSRNLLGERLLGHRLGRSYSSAINRFLVHENIWPASHWVGLVEAAGLRVEKCRTLLSARATVIWELLLPLALASRIWRRAFGRRPPHPNAAVRILKPFFEKYVADSQGTGSNLLLVAGKPADASA